VQTKFTKLVFNGTQNCLLVHLVKIFLKPIFVRETLLVVSLIVPLNLKWRNFFIKFSFLYCFEVESFFESEFIFVLLLLNSIVFMWIKKNYIYIWYEWFSYLKLMIYNISDTSWRNIYVNLENFSINYFSTTSFQKSSTLVHLLEWCPE
jgi:hypothetical protein